MFSVYGVTGQTFRGTLEHLIQVPGVYAARHGRGIHREGEEIGAEFETVRRRAQGEEQGGAEADPRYAEAAAAYTRMLRRDSERDSVRHAYQMMCRDVLSLRTGDTVGSAWHMLAARRLRQAPVLDVARRVVGLVSERDLLTVLDLRDGRVTGSLERRGGEGEGTPPICARPGPRNPPPSRDLRRPGHRYPPHCPCAAGHRPDRLAGGERSGRTGRCRLARRHPARGRGRPAPESLDLELEQGVPHVTAHPRHHRSHAAAESLRSRARRMAPGQRAGDGRL